MPSPWNVLVHCGCARFGRAAALVIFAGAALLSTASARAQNLEAVLEAGLQVEASLLESELDRYVAARTDERRAFQEWEGLLRQLDQLLQSQGTPIEELRRLEGQATLAREAALARSRRVTELRGRLLDHMERIAVIERRLDLEERTRLVPASPLDGLWQLEVAPIGLSGLVRMRVDGALVTGTYRLENGSAGSVTGTFADGELQLERIDVQQGFDSTLEGQVDVGAGMVRGSWRSVDVTGGAISGGSWTARKLSAREERQVEAEMGGDG